MIVAQGILTARGGTTSHAAVVARGMGKPCVVGAEAIARRPGTRRRSRVERHDRSRKATGISIDGTTGEVFVGEFATIEPELRRGERAAGAAELGRRGPAAGRLGQRRLPARGRARARARRRGHRPLPHRAHVHGGRAAADRAADDPRRAGRRGEGDGRRRRSQLEHARPNGAATAEGELAEAERGSNGWQRTAALDQLLPIQRGDFKGMLEAMDGLPVIIRLLDPPLHEFLPKYEDLLVEVTELRMPGQRPAPSSTRSESCSQAVDATARAEPDARPARLPAGPAVPRDQRDAGPGDLRGRGRAEAGGRRPAPRDHDPAGRRRAASCARVQRACSKPWPKDVIDGGEARGRLQVRHDDRDPARRPHRRPDRRGGRVLQLRHQRPDPDDLRLLPRRRRGQVPGRTTSRTKILPDNPFQTLDREGVGELMRDRRRAGPRRPARTSRSASAASTAATRRRSRSATRRA